MEKYFKEKVIIITGASSGIGKSLAITMSQSGAKVALAARRESKLEEIKSQILSEGNQAITIKADVSKLEDNQRLMQSVLKEWNRIDIFIANAGQYVQKDISDCSVEEFQKSMDVNFYGPYHGINYVLPIMKSQNSGSIVIINSLDAYKGIVGDGPYVAAKSALSGFAEVLRQEVKNNGINIISVFPGRVDTPMIADIKVPWISPKISIDKAVRAILKGIIKNKPIVVVPKMYYFLGAMNNIFPSLMDWMYAKLKLEGEKNKINHSV